MPDSNESSASGQAGWRRLAPWTTPDSLTGWLERTTWWARPPAMKTQQQMLVELLEAVAGRFLGRVVTLEAGGHHVTLTLDQVRVEATETVRIESSQVTFDDRPVGDVVATVQSVRLEYGMTTDIVTGAVDLEVQTSRHTVLDWLARSVSGWHVGEAKNGLLSIRHDDWRFTVLAALDEITAAGVAIDVIGVRLLGRDVRIPRRFVRHETIELPRLADELELVDARVDGDIVTARLRHAGIRQPVRLEHLRAAVREGVSQLGSLVFS